LLALLGERLGEVLLQRFDRAVDFLGAGFGFLLVERIERVGEFAGLGFGAAQFLQIVEGLKQLRVERGLGQLRQILHQRLTGGQRDLAALGCFHLLHQFARLGEFGHGFGERIEGVRIGRLFGVGGLFGRGELGFGDFVEQFGHGQLVARLGDVAVFVLNRFARILFEGAGDFVDPGELAFEQGLFLFRRERTHLGVGIGRLEQLFELGFQLGQLFGFGVLQIVQFGACEFGALFGLLGGDFGLLLGVRQTRIHVFHFLDGLARLVFGQRGLDAVLMGFGRPQFVLNRLGVALLLEHLTGDGFLLQFVHFSAGFLERGKVFSAEFLVLGQRGVRRAALRSRPEPRRSPRPWL